VFFDTETWQVLDAEQQGDVVQTADVNVAGTQVNADVNEEIPPEPNFFQSTGFMIIMMVVLVGAFYLFAIRPQRKKDKATQQMRSSITVGDEIVTIGGIIGRVVSIKDETYVVETGSEKNKMRVKKWAIQERITVKEDSQ